MKRGWKVLLHLLLTLLSLYGCYRVSMRLAIRRHLATVRAQGGPTSPDELVTMYQGAVLSEKAATYVARLEHSFEESLYYQEWTTPDAQQYLAINAALWLPLRQAAAEGAVFPCSGEMVHFYAWTALGHFQAGDPERGIALLEELAALRTDIRPLRGGVDSRAFRTGALLRDIVSILNSHELSDQHLARLAACVAKFDDPDLVQRWLSALAADGPRGLWDGADEPYELAFGKHKPVAVFLGRVLDLESITQAELLGALARIAPATRISLAHGLAEASRAGATARPPFVALKMQMAKEMRWRMELAALASTHLQVAKVAIAAERYRLAHSIWPQRIDDLVPVFLGRALLDPRNNQPVLFRMEADRFTVFTSEWGLDGQKLHSPFEVGISARKGRSKPPQ
jgi:hypothetical protein